MWSLVTTNSVVRTNIAWNCYYLISPWSKGRHFADDIFRCILAKEKFSILIEISLKFASKSPIGNNPALAKIRAWRRIGDKPLSESMLTQFTEAYMRHEGEVGLSHYRYSCCHDPILLVFHNSITRSSQLLLLQFPYRCYQCHRCCRFHHCYRFYQLLHFYAAMIIACQIISPLPKRRIRQFKEPS